jgi:dCTP deaminase
MSVLNNEQIINYREQGEIIIEPFDPLNVNSSSYDVRLGEWYFREQKANISADNIDPNANVYNMYDEDHVKKVWGEPQKALPYSYYKEQGLNLKNIDDDDLIIMIGPGESILAHTQEFIGGVSKVTTMMHARSSTGRNFITVCKCAGWGDIGYKTRWTYEISNVSRNHKIPLVVGRRIAQIIFFEMEQVNEKINYISTGKYQNGEDIDEIMNKWTPYDMLPKMYKDRELTNKNVIDEFLNGFI